MTTQASREAKLRYRRSHPEKNRYISYKSMARSFIRRMATDEDLTMLESLIQAKRQTSSSK